MAEAVGSDIVTASLQPALSLAYQEFKSAFMDFKSNVESLQNSKAMIEAVLCDVDSGGHGTNHAEQVTLGNLRDQLDRLMYFFDQKESRALHKQVMGGSRLLKEARLFFSPSNQLFARFKDARKIKHIRKQLDSIARDHAQLGSIVSMLRPSSSQAQAWSVQTTASDIITDVVVGRENDKDAVISMIVDDSVAAEFLSVSAITGIGGMGKTTLAWYVYNDQLVTRSFEARFWVDATRDFDVKKMLEKIAQPSCSVKNDLGSHPALETDQTRECYDLFTRAIAGKKFLLVLDNIWDHQGLRLKWLNLRRLLEFGAHGSKVLVTTRDRKVAGLMDCRSPYALGGLTAEDSWFLFQQIAFTPWQEPGVKAIGEDIATLCPRVPLVIRSLGGVLAGKPTLEEWQAFRTVQQANFASYGPDVVSTLKLSFDQLGAKLRICALYLSLFPRGYWFEISQLIRLWISLGYVVPVNENQSLDEAGKEYVISLINYDFLILNFNDLTSLSSNVVVHDVMHDLLRSLAGSGYKMVVGSKMDEFDNGVRHLSIHPETDFSVWEVHSSLFKIKNLESFMMYNSPYSRYEIKVSNWSMCDKLISRSKLLKVLVLSRLHIKELPESIGGLISLRYLDLSESAIVKLPKSITNLVYLLSLDLRWCVNLQELPKSMSKLVKLRHLILSGCRNLSHMPTGLGTLTNLRTLDLFVVSEQSSWSETRANAMGGLSVLRGLNHLTGWLHIKICTESKDIAEDAREANLKMKEKLRDLTIEFKRSTKEDKLVLEGLQPHAEARALDISGYGGERLPNWMMDNQLHSLLPNLVLISLEDCKSCRHICSLGRLPHLECLILKGLDNVEYMERSTSSSSDCNGTEDELSYTPLFPSLEMLVVKKMPKLKGWWKMLSSSGNHDSSQLPQVLNQQQHLVEWKPSCPKLKELNVDTVELAIAIGRSLLKGSTSIHSLIFEGISENSSPPRQQRQASALLNNCFPYLTHLRFSLHDLEVLPQDIQYFSSLERLEISCCKRFQALPDWIDNLTSLKSIQIFKCPLLDSLPHQISNLSTLQSLSIILCSRLLKERCQNPTGECWPYIEHIPRVIIRCP